MDSDKWTDEDGRCIKTELLADQCACDRHRGGVVVSLVDFVFLGRPWPAHWDGICGRCNHKIEVGDECAYAREVGQNGQFIVRLRCCGKDAKD